MLKGEAPDREPMPDYALHIELENKYLASKSFERDREYWKSMLKDIQPAAAKNTPTPRSALWESAGLFAVSNRMNRMIAGFCREKKVSPFCRVFIWLWRSICAGSKGRSGSASVSPPLTV